MIHREGITVLELLGLAQKYFRHHRQLARKSALTEKEIRTRDDYNKAMYEIARIFAFASMYIDIEHVPGK